MQGVKVGEFVMSIDYELYWGMYDSRSLSSYKGHIIGVHTVLPQILDLFERYEIKATIAFVGLLLCKNLNEVVEKIPDSMLRKPGIPMRLSEHIENMRTDMDVNELHFDNGVIDRLIRTGSHELASHSFSHYYCQEPHSSIDEFQEDIGLLKEITRAKEISLSSFVFPRNQYLNSHLELLKESGYQVYRGNPKMPLHRKGNGLSTNIFVRLLRLMDSYVSISGDMTSAISDETDEKTLRNVPASLFLRPVSSSGSILYNLQLRRIKKCMSQAAIKGRRFHLWWHPHNFGKHSKANLNLLEDILLHFKKLQDEYGFENKTMSESAGMSTS